MDRYEFEGPSQTRWTAERTGDHAVRFSVSAEEGGPSSSVAVPTYSDVIGPELLRVVEERDRFRDALALAETRLADAERDRSLAVAKIKELRAKLEAERSLDREQEMWVHEGEVRGYAEAEGDIKELIERRERNWRAAPFDAIPAAKATECAAILVDIGRGLHCRPAPEMMDTPDGPRPLPGSIDAAAYAFPDTAPNPAGGEGEYKPLTTADVRRMRRELAAKMGPERPAGAFEKSAPAPAELEGWLGALEGRVVALEKAVGEITVTSEATLLDPEPLRRLAEMAKSIELREPDAANLHITTGRVLRALREAGVIPGE